jgi:hypothetical protein
MRLAQTGLQERGYVSADAEAVRVERVHFGSRFSFDAEGRPYTPENIDGRSRRW